FIDLLFSLNPREFRIVDVVAGKEQETSRIPMETDDQAQLQQAGLFDLLAKRYASSMPSEADYRRPMISLHRIDDLRELGAFFRQIGEHTRRMTLSLAKPDIKAIEANLREDLAYPVESMKR
ncbi:hypothetical protein SYNPS1DRAFT_23816, partial [Syncephalis pseudoplumigaleata]